MKKPLLIISALAFTLLFVRGADAAATCFCKLSTADLTNLKSANGVVRDLTGDVNKTYTGAFQQGDQNQTDCNTRCTNAAAQYTGNASFAAQLCAAGVGNNATIRAWSAVGTREYKSAQYIGVLINTPAVTKTTCVCPPDAMANTTNELGGVTVDGKCKKGICGPYSGITPPPNGTQIGTWGFTWGNGFYAWIAPKCATAVTTPAVCRFK